jgi:adenosylhomocysteine nucleosidase
MDVSLTLACALEVEERAARRGGARTALVGLRASLPLPDGRLVGFGLAGALVPGLEPGALVTAERIVDEWGRVLWEGEPIRVDGASTAVICAAADVVDEPESRRALAERTGAVAVDMESAVLARTGRLAGVVRAVSDTPTATVGGLASAATADGRTDWGVVVKSAVKEPVKTVRAVRGARKALASLERAAEALR